jgi:hypothetical protein
MRTHNSPENLDRRAARAVQVLTQWAVRWDHIHAHQRRHVRHICMARLTVYPAAAALDTDGLNDVPAVEVWVQNVSEGGLGFLYHAAIPETHVVVALPTASGGPTYMRAEIVRRRPVHDGFFEYGAKFTGRIAR